MPDGSFTYSPPQIPLGGFAMPVMTFLLDPDEGYIVLPNVQVLEIQFREGNDIPSARFAYIMDDRAVFSNFPNQFEQLWPLNLPDPNETDYYIARPGDRLVVFGFLSDGTPQIMFDGFARMPQADVSPDSQGVNFSAVGAAFRGYDVPVNGRIQRDVRLPDIGTSSPTDLPTRFNPSDATHPSGQPNCTQDGYDEQQDDASTSYPLFIEPNSKNTLSKSGKTIPASSFWTLSKAIRYILAVLNPEEDPNDPTYEQFIQNPNFQDLNDLLDNRRPKDPDWIGYFNPKDPSNYTSDPIIIRDFDATNMAWPDVVERLLGYHDFGMRWVLGQDDDLMPINTFEVYRKDAANPNEPKPLFLPPKGTPLDPASANVATMSASFDFHDVYNEYVIETHPNRYEVGVILAPLFTPVAGDEVSGTRKQFTKSALDANNANDEDRKKYRWYGADECGEGHWDLVNNQWVTLPIKFSPIFGKTYARHFRPGKQECLTDVGDLTDNKLQAQLAISRDYAGDPGPVLWDGSGTWQPIRGGSWRLLEDRLGIDFTADDLEAIPIGKYNKKTDGPKAQNSGPTLHGIKSIANPSPPGDGGSPNYTSGKFFLRLTTVIEGDYTIEAKAERRDASPITNVIQRRIDAKDHWRKDTITKSSGYYDTALDALEDVPVDQFDVDDDDNLIVRDDTDAARDHAIQLRTAHEFPKMPLAITIPGISFAYRVGDRLDYIYGRNVSLQTNAGSEQDEPPAYPFIVSVAWQFAGDNQLTTIQASDRRMEPAPVQSWGHRGR